jgi:hypothetical protein
VGTFELELLGQAGAYPFPRDWDNLTTGLEMQTTDHLPPVTYLDPLPDFVRASEATISWRVHDFGGAVVSGYGDIRLQYRNGNAGPWQTWLATQSWEGGSMPFEPGQPGQTVAFRAQGVDRAGNLEPLPAQPQAQTTLFHTHQTGQVVDARGYPLSGATFTAAPEMLRPSADFSAPPGAYTLYAASGAEHVVGASRAPYGTFAPARLSLAEDVQHTFVLPPAPNLIANPDFEQLALGWQLAGDAVAESTGSEGRHSGHASLRLGRPFAPQEQELLPTWAFSHLVDSFGNLHMAHVRREGNQAMIQYAVREPGAPVPQDPTVIGTFDSSSQWGGLGWVTLFSDGAGGVHLLIMWREVGTDTPYHCWKSADAPLCTAVSAFPNLNPDGQVSVAHDSSGPPFVLNSSNSNGIFRTLLKNNDTFYLATRSSDGVWQTEAIPLPSFRYAFQIAADAAGRIYLLSVAHEQGFYLEIRSTNGTWQIAQQPVIRESSRYTRVWIHQNELHLLHIRQTPYSVPEYPYTAYNNMLIHSYRPAPGAAWTATELLNMGRYEPDSINMVLDHEGNGWFFLRWRTPQPDAPHLSRSHNALVRKPHGEPWLPAATIPFTSPPEEFRLVHAEMFVLPDGGIGFLEQHLRDNPFLSRYRISLYPALEEARSGRAAQTVTIPAAAHQPAFGAVVRQVVPIPTGQRLLLQVDHGGELTDVATVTEFTGEWQIVSADLTPWAGQTVTATLRYEQPAGSIASALFVDDVSLGDWRTPVITAVSPVKVPKGSPITLTGLNFMPGATVRVGTVAWAVISAETTTLTAAMPATMPPGLYPVFVRNPGGEEAAWAWLQVGERLLLPVIAR